jgi:hypothetical protein
MVRGYNMLPGRGCRMLQGLVFSNKPAGMAPELRRCGYDVVGCASLWQRCGWVIAADRPVTRMTA